jgi:hypothetical protein
VHVCAKLPLFSDLQQKVGELVLSITCPSIIILENTLNSCIEKNVVMVTLATGMFFLFTYKNIWVWAILGRWSACEPRAYEVFRD